jgi:site-specific recombinase XerD
LDTFSENSTFKTYYSSFKHFLEWCSVNEVNPKVVTESGLCRYVRGRLEDNVSV